MRNDALYLHDYNFLGLVNDQEQRSSTLYFEYQGRRATIRLTGVKNLILYDFLAGNIVQSAYAWKIGEIADTAFITSKAQIVEIFSKSARQEYFLKNVEDFFRHVSDDDYFTYITGTYGADFFAISESCAVEHVPPSPPGEITTIYVALLNEGTDVRRPVNARLLADGNYEIIDPQPHPEDEEWEFASGAKVRCEIKELSTGSALVAVEPA